METQHSRGNMTKTRRSTGQDRRVTKLIKKSAARFIVYLLLLTTTLQVITSRASSSSPQNLTTRTDQLPQNSNGSRARLLTKRHPSAVEEAEPLDDSQAGPHFQPLALDSASTEEPAGAQSAGCASGSQAARGGNKYRTLYACEEKQLQIECQLGESIQVIRANYGRFSLSLCNDHGLVDLRVNCMAPSSTTIIANSCQGKQSCQLLASNSIFGDPCPFTQKYLEVHYQCVCNAASNKTQEQQHQLDQDKPNQRPKQANVIVQQQPPQASEQSAGSTTSERPQQWPAPAHLPPWMPSEVAALSTMRPPPSASVLTAAVNQRPRCPEIVWRQIRWPATEAGQVAQQACPAHTLPVTADTPSLVCLPSANWGPHLQSARCQSLWLRNLTQRLEAGDSPLSTLTELVLKTRPAGATWSGGAQQQGLFGDDVALIGRVVRRLVDETGEMLNRIADDKQRMVFAREMVQLLAELVNNLAGDRLDAWTDLGQLAGGERQRVAGQLAQSLERAAVLLAGSQPGEHLATQQQAESPGADSFVRAADNVYLAIRSLPASSGNRSLQVTFPSEQSTLGTKWMSTEQRFTLHLQTAPAPDPLQSAQVDVKPPEEQHQASSALKIVFVMLRGLGNQMGPSPQDETHMVVNSNLVSMSIVADARYKYAPVKVDLSAPIELAFQHLRVRGETGSSSKHPLCAYWDANHSGWLSDGCKLVGSNRTHSTCACNHLTSFALLADSSGVADELQLLATLDQANTGLLDGAGQNQPQQSRAEQPKVQLDSVDNELSLANGRTLYLAKMLDGLLFTSDPSATSAPNARLLVFVSCLLSALLLALQLAAAAYNQTQTRRLLGAMPSQPPPPLLVASSHQTIMRRPQVAGGSTNSDASPTYSTSDYSSALAHTKSKLEQGASAADQQQPRIAQLRLPVSLVFQLLTLQLLLVLLAETQGYLQRNMSPARVSAAQAAALLGFPLFAQQPAPAARDLSSLLPPVGPVTWAVVGFLYYLVAAFTCWLIAQLVRLNLALWRVAPHSQQPNSCTISSSGSSGASDKSAHYGATNSTNLSASANPVAASIYGRSLYGPSTIYGQQQQAGNLRAGTSPSSSFSSANGHSLADNQTHRTLARLEDSARLYAATSAHRPAEAKGMQLLAQILPRGLIEHALPLAFVVLVGWLSVSNSRALNTLFYTSSLGHQLAYWPLLVDASSAPLALILYYVPAVCLVLASLAAVRLRRRCASHGGERAGGSAAIGSIVNPYGSSSLAAAIGARNGALDLALGSANEQALNKQSACENAMGIKSGLGQQPADARRAKFLCGWLVALLALHSICWISFFGHVHQALNTQGAQSARLVYTFAASNLVLVLTLTWLQRRSLRRAASLAGLGQALSRCSLCLCRSSVVGSRASRARFYRAASEQHQANGDVKVSASSQSLFLANQQQQQQHYGQHLYAPGYHSPAQQHLYQQVGQPQQQAHIYDSATNALGDQQHRLNMIQMMQQQQRQQQQLHQMHQLDQQQQHNFALNRSMSSLNHPQAQQPNEQRQPMTLKPMANTILPMMFNQQRLSPTSQAESQQASGQLLVLDAAAALKQQQLQQQQYNLHLGADQQPKTLMGRGIQQQQSGEADGPLVAFSSSSGQPPTTFGPTNISARHQPAQQASFPLHQHQLSGRPLFSERRRSASPQPPINCISPSEHSALRLGCSTSGRPETNNQQHQYCSIAGDNHKSCATDQQQQQHFRHASGKLMAQRHQPAGAAAMIDRVAANNIYDVANYALGQ